MKKKISILIAVIMVIAGAFWAKGYYNDRYVASDSFYTQVPADEVNEDSWLVDADGVKQAKGKEYNLIGYNKDGEAREVSFKVNGSVENYYAPGTYIKVDTSKTIVLGQQTVEESDIPQKVLEEMKENGTKTK